MKVYYRLLPLVIEVQLYVSLVWATRFNDSTQANTLDTTDNDVEAEFNNNNNNKKNLWDGSQRVWLERKMTKETDIWGDLLQGHYRV